MTAVSYFYNYSQDRDVRGILFWELIYKLFLYDKAKRLVLPTYLDDSLNSNKLNVDITF